MPSSRAVWWARVAVIAAASLAVWAMLLAITGGLRYDVGPLRVSSRNPVRPALLAILFAAIAWRLAYQEWLEIRLQRLESASRRVELAMVLAAAGGLLVLGLLYGVRAAGGSDALGYVSESWLWLQQNLKLDHRVSSEVPWPDATGTFAPLGYKTLDGQVLVPTYPPGLPLMMAASRLMSSCGPYYIGPVCGALLVVFTYLLGRKYFSGAVAVVGAILTAASPTVLYMTMNPMADVPAATFWIAALVVAGPSSVGRAVAAGVLTGVAIAIRPNLVVLALFPWLLSIARCGSAGAIVTRTVAFGLGVMPFVALVAGTNAHLYGSALESGYGPLAPGFKLEHVARNIARYPAWWLESQGILAFLFVVGLLRRHTRHRLEAVVLIAFAAALVLMYLFYLPFDAWWFLRFLLPAIPLAFLFSADALEWAASRRQATARFAAFVAFTLLTVAHTVNFNRETALFQIGESEQKYVDAGLFVDRATPADAVIVSMQHSGSIRYYSGRLTLRYDSLDPAWLDRAIESLEKRGRPVYLLIDEWEEKGFRQRFQGQRALRDLEKPAATGRAGMLRFYPMSGAPFTAASPRIPRISRSACPDVSPGFATAGRATPSGERE